jgi:Short-chain dehydrogenases of various substrate specificities
MTQSQFQGNVTIVTGASAGIGLEIARQLASVGAKLVLAARDPALLDSAATACRALGADVLAVPTDVGESEQCRRLIEQTVETFGRVDTLVNNAGISMHARFDQLSDVHAVDRITRINYFGSVYCTWFALPYLKRTRGRIVGVSSITGKNGVPTRTLYAGTKHAMAGFFDSLRIELKPEGVSVTMVYPGFVATDIAHRALGPDGNPLGTRPVKKELAMPVEECARQIIAAAAERKREVIMRKRAKLGMLAKVFFPEKVDDVARRTIERGH